MFSTTNEKAEAAFVAAKCGEEFCSRKNRRRYYSGIYGSTKLLLAFLQLEKKKKKKKKQKQMQKKKKKKQKKQQKKKVNLSQQSRRRFQLSANLWKP